MSSMSSHDTDVPVEQQHRYSGAQPAGIGHESEDEQASVLDEDVVVIETYDPVDDRDLDASEHREASPGIILSAAASGPAEAMTGEQSAGDAAEAVAPETTYPKTAMHESAESPAPETESAAPETTAPADVAPETVVPATTAPDTTGSALADNRQFSGWPATGAPGADAGPWSEIKAMFVDDPGESVKRASGMVERAMENLMISLRDRQESLASWQENDATGTEELRNALRGYQSLFDQLDGMSDRFRTAPDRMGRA
ncbi:MAG TPA: hypothetical protein VHJ18_26510 [Streptosporangiaceae bacterium]|jgi:hypothetical protein|nr:hypothetical protein [Streptosporangiaceae bacterium]